MYDDESRGVTPVHHADPDSSTEDKKSTHILFSLFKDPNFFAFHFVLQCVFE